MILSKAEYLQSINLLLPDNSTQEISPLDLRTSLIDLVDSVTNFIDGNIEADNFSTPDTRTTRAGILSLDSLNYAGRSSEDNSAFGFATLRNNYSGSGNSAFGSYALSCNLYGNNNTALGHHSLAGKVNGSGNVGVGNYAINNSKNGNFNIGIGHGAGYFIGKEDNYKLFIGSYAIDSGNLCDVDQNLQISGESPLIYGNLDPSDHKLGIGVQVLHNFGMLQVSGDVSPSVSEVFHLGRTEYPWKSINENVYFSGGLVGVGGQPSGAIHGISDGKMTVYGDLVPSESGRFALGHPSLPWDGYFNDVIISGQVLVNDIEYNTISECLYECKTLHLATSGFCDPEDLGFHNSAVCGYLSDSALDGAGFEVHSSGSDYVRDYRFIYKFPDQDIKCLEDDNAFSRSRWQSNISLQVTSGNHLQTDRVISNNGRDKIAFMHQSGCMGMFIEPVAESGQTITFAQEEHIENDYYGVTDVNFISRSGTDVIQGSPSGYNYGVTYATVDSGVKVMQRFLSRVGSDGVRGFSLVYHDERDGDGDIDCGLLGYNELDCINTRGLLCDPVFTP